MINARLRSVLLPAYEPCVAFSGSCHSMRWDPENGHVPRGFYGATASLVEVKLVLVVAEPGDPREDEDHSGASPGKRLESTFSRSHRGFESTKDQFHANVRWLLNRCWPGKMFDEQMRKVWITESVLCSAAKEGGHVPVAVTRECRDRYLEAQLALFENAVVIALGKKAQKRLAGLSGVIAAASVAPPGCNFRGARGSWEAVARKVQES